MCIFCCKTSVALGPDGVGGIDSRHAPKSVRGDAFRGLPWPPRAAHHQHPPAPISTHHLPQPPTTTYHLPPPTTTYHHLPPLTTTYHHYVPPPTTNDKYDKRVVNKITYQIKYEIINIIRQTTAMDKNHSN